jgi:glycosyltransferase involved in cell wall biosynthesis
MRILYVSHGRGAHGACGSLLTLAVALKQRGDTPLVVVPAAGPLAQALAKNGIETAEIDCPWWFVDPGTSLKSRQWYFRRAIQAAHTLAPVIRQFKPDLVHTNSAVIPSGALAARMAGVPHIWHLREQPVEHYEQHFLVGRPLSLWLMGAWSEALIAVSRSVANAYCSKAAAKKLRVIYNGVDLAPEVMARSLQREQCEESPRAPVLALSGALHPAKGQEQAILALADLHRRGIMGRLSLIGADPVGYRPHLEATADQLGISQYVQFTGFLSDPFSAVARADIALVCSRCEGFGRVTVEAMLLKKPIVAANTCGSLELIADGETGLLYDWGNPIDLADKVEHLLRNPEFAATLGDAAYAVARSQFSVERYASLVLRAYEDVLNPGQGRKE